MNEIKIGRYTIEDSGKGLFIQKDREEAGDFPYEDVEKCIDDFFNKNF